MTWFYFGVPVTNIILWPVAHWEWVQPPAFPCAPSVAPEKNPRHPHARL